MSTATMSTRPARMTMLFDFFKKKEVVAKPVDAKFKPSGSIVSSVTTMIMILISVYEFSNLRRPLTTTNNANPFPEKGCRQGS